jgi:hypothetical protein
MQYYDCSCCLNGCETWSLTLKEEHRLRVCENRVLKKVFGPNRAEVAVAGQDCTMTSFMISTSQ